MTIYELAEYVPDLTRIGPEYRTLCWNHQTFKWQNEICIKSLDLGLLLPEA